MSYFEKKLKSEYSRSQDLHEVIDDCELVLNSGENDVSKSCAAVIMAYKSIELNEDELVFRSLSYVNSMLEKLQFSWSENKSFSSVRRDPGQVYLSLLTVRWHLDLYSGSFDESVVLKVVDFSKNDNVVSITYLQNVSRAVLVLAFYKYIKGDSGSVLSLAEWMLCYFKKQVNSNISGAGFIESSHFGDIRLSCDCIQSLMAGVEWVNGTRQREKFWGEGAVYSRSSRVKVESFKSRFMSALL